MGSSHGFGNHGLSGEMPSPWVSRAQFICEERVSTGYDVQENDLNNES